MKLEKKGGELTIHFMLKKANHAAVDSNKMKQNSLQI